MENPKVHRDMANARLAPSPYGRFSIGDDDHTLLIIR